MNMQPDDALRLARQLQSEGRSKQEAQTEVARRMLDMLNPEQSEQLRKLMNDKDALEKLINSPQAKDLMKRFGQAE